MRLYGVHDIHFRNVHVNAESGFSTCDGGDCTTFLRLSKYPFDNAIEDEPDGSSVREREFARLDVSAAPTAAAPAASMRGAAVRKLAGGFEAAGGGAVDAKGTLYFIDRITQRIYGWSPAGLAIISSHPLDPVNLAVDHSGNLLVLSSAGITGTVYSLRPEGPDGASTVIEPEPAGRHPAAAIAVAGRVVGQWRVQGSIRSANRSFHDPGGTLRARGVCGARPASIPRPMAAWSCRPIGFSIRVRPIIAAGASHIPSTLTDFSWPSLAHVFM